LRWSAPEILSWVRATTADNIPVERLKEFLIPLPPLEEQKRIAGIMEESDALLKMRKQSITLVSDLPLALFNRFFGREGTYANTLEMHPLRDLVTIRSGGTPSKSKPEFWNGDIPWVSPKDMKPREIWDSEDHITELSTTQAALKLVPPESVLIVVRGMILVHTVPIRLTRRPVTINQDMKALIPREGVDPLFLRWALESIHSDLLASVSTASHGTKRLETDTLLRFALPVPPICAQREFATAAAKVEHLRSNLDLSQQSLLSLFDGLQSELFNGEDSVSQVMREAPIHV
jgi:type I restriction enzyme S subunit